jgi:hypothetical protein
MGPARDFTVAGPGFEMSFANEISLYSLAFRDGRRMFIGEGQGDCESHPLTDPKLQMDAGARRALTASRNPPRYEREWIKTVGIEAVHRSARRDPPD